MMVERAGINGQSLGENLRRLRRKRNLSQQKVAEKAKISVPTYRNIETGKSIPKLETLQMISDALGSSIMEMLRPVRIPKAVRFRAKKNLRTRNEILSDVTRKLEIYSEFEDLVGRDKVESYIDKVKEEIKSLPSKDRVEQAAAKVREHWEIGSRDPIRNISGLFANNGVRVLPIEKNSSDFFGLSVGEEGLGPAVAVNIWERISVERWIFSAAHELGHLILHCDSFDVDQTEENQKEEREADRFASYFLMPEEAFDDELKELRGMQLFDVILTLKRIFKVSWKTVVMRLIDKGLLGDSAWKDFYSTYSRKTGGSLKGHKEPSPLLASEFASEEPETLRKPDFPVNQLEALVSLALQQGKITMSRAAEAMGVSVSKMRETVKGWELSPST